MDVFQQNWTQRMHNEPFTSYILNGKGNKDEKIIAEYIHFERRREPRYTYHVYPWDEEQESIIKAGVNRDRLHVLRGKRGFADGYGLPYSHSYKITKSDKLYDNSRPLSLYNLNYASLR